MYLGAVGADLAMYVTKTSTNTRPHARLTYYAANLDRPLLKGIPLIAENVNVNATGKQFNHPLIWIHGEMNVHVSPVLFRQVLSVSSVKHPMGLIYRYIVPYMK